MSIRVVIADDHPVVCEGLVRLLHGPEFEVISKAHTGVGVLETCQTLQPDVLVLDICMPDKSGLAVLEELKQTGSAVKVVVLSGLENTTYVARSLALGATDFVAKVANGEVIVASLRRRQSLDEAKTRCRRCRDSTDQPRTSGAKAYRGGFE